jgi:uncharacterized phage protein (TIGR02218 family)
MKTASGTLTTALAQETTYLCRLWTLTIDGAARYFTDAPDDVVYNGHTWEANPSFELSAIQQTADGGVQNGTIKIALGESSFTEADVRSGLLDKAPFSAYVTDYRTPDGSGAVLFFSGVTDQVTFTNTQWAEVDLIGNLGAGTGLSGEVYSKTCRAQLGDARCTVDIEALRYSGAVETVDASNMFFSSSVLVGPAADFFKFGFVRWRTGENTGFSDDVISYDTATGIVGFILTPRYLIQAGDEFDILPGCDFQASTCKAKFDNLVNFRGEALAPPPDANPLSNIDWGAKMEESIGAI